MTGFVIKLIALSTMIIDHLGAVYPMYFPFAFRVVGRAAFPLFAFLIAEGCRNTRSMSKYLLRLGVFALVSEIPFDLAFSKIYFNSTEISFIGFTNIFYTLFLGTLAIFAFQKLKERGVIHALFSVIPLAASMWLASFLTTDYGARGVLLIFLLYAVPKKIPRLIVMAGYLVYMYGAFLWLALFGEEGFAPFINMYATGVLAGALASVAVAAFYNGKRGPGMKWFFYAVYPAHLLLFAGVYQAMVYFNLF